VFTVTPDHPGCDKYDVAAQGLVSHHYRPRNGHTEVLTAVPVCLAG
jgi:hypothetical protein